ncbi:MAG: hypothetical protein JXR37_31530 [Kiritimatiellae bacterium]|nr:hypothetical protein [Kiritimatiellia bacterium]
MYIPSSQLRITNERSTAANPLIAGAFHRTGAVEVWGRGTNRVIAACRAHGAAPPIFEEQQGFVVVTFRAEMVPGAGTRPESQPATRPESATQLTTQSTDPVVRLLNRLAQGAMFAGELQSALKIKHRPTFRANYLHPALAKGLSVRVRSAAPALPRRNH